MARTTTDAANWRFQFTVTELARFLGKSPVTLRHWERQGLIVFPRDQSGDRKLSTSEVRYVAQIAKKLGRINDDRLRLVEASITLLEIIEKENIRHENRSNGRTRIGKKRLSTATL